MSSTLKDSRRIVHLVFKTHLDLGFTHLARDVVRNYQEHFIPQALDLARQMRVLNPKRRFVWTVGSWLIDDCLRHYRGKQLAKLERGIEEGDIVWHALPFTVHSELLDPSLFRFGLSLSQRLDKRFGKHTIAAKMTDVPGHTRGIVPMLADAGVKFLHIGVNPASTPPEVPTAFMWRCAGSDVMTVYSCDYGDTVEIPGLADRLSICFTGDNRGPQSRGDIERIYDELEQRYPGAQVMASTLDGFAIKAATIVPKLPVIENELGDTWIHGVGTDPVKVRKFRALCRLRRQWLSAHPELLESEPFQEFSRTLLLIPEHTWGLNENVHLVDYKHYTASSFRKFRQTEKFKYFESSWAEQRQYLTTAVRALKNKPLAVEAQRCIRNDLAKPFRPGKAVRSCDLSQVMETEHFQVRFDPQTGGVVFLANKTQGTILASPRHPLGLFSYQTFSQADYDRFIGQYLRNLERTRGWAIPDFSKPGIAEAGAISGSWQPMLDRAWQWQTSAGETVLLSLRMPKEAVRRYGAPARVELQVEFPHIKPTVIWTLRWFEKPATRLPAAAWMSFIPRTGRGAYWELDKLGQTIRPEDVIRNGNRRLHAIDRGVVCHDKAGSFRIDSPDVPLVALGEPTLLRFDDFLPKASGGIHFNLLNNVWGTNFPMWSDDNVTARFEFCHGHSIADVELCGDKKREKKVCQKKSF